MKKDVKTVKAIVEKCKDFLFGGTKTIIIYRDLGSLTITLEQIETTTIYRVIDKRNEAAKKARVVVDFESEYYCEWSGYKNETEILNSLNN